MSGRDLLAYSCFRSRRTLGGNGRVDRCSLVGGCSCLEGAWNVSRVSGNTLLGGLFARFGLGQPPRLGVRAFWRGGPARFAIVWTRYFHPVDWLGVGSSGYSTLDHCT